MNHASWVEARGTSDFSIFRADLEREPRQLGGSARLTSRSSDLERTLEKADCLGFEQTRYDPLLDEFEPWMTTAELRGVLDALRAPLVDLLQRITASGVQLDDSVLRRDYDVAAQRAFSDHLLAALGFSSDSGRLDVSAHPFSTTLGVADGRLTTRFYPNLLSASIFGTIHECGHGLHGLGVAPELATTELGDGTSLGICESQSRFWENLIARRRAFWEHFYPELQPRFPALADVGLDQFYRAVNAVQPSLIRVEADEVTYNLHILLRFGLERRLVDGEIEVADLPQAWREESRELLGIVPERDADGVLQDIHWSMFLVGYFPTYSLGNLYSAQFHAAMARDIGDWEEQVRRGEFGQILGLAAGADPPPRARVLRHRHLPAGHRRAAERAPLPGLPGGQVRRAVPPVTGAVGCARRQPTRPRFRTGSRCAAAPGVCSATSAGTVTTACSGAAPTSAAGPGAPGTHPSQSRGAAPPHSIAAPAT